MHGSYVYNWSLSGKFSEELKILERNTVQLMIDEMQEEIDVQKETIIQKDQEIERLKKLLAEK